MFFSKKSFLSENQQLPVKYLTWLLLFISAAAYLYMGYGLSRPQFLLYLSVYLVLFAAYLHFLKRNLLSTHEQPVYSQLEGLSAAHTGLLLNRKSNLQFFIGAAILFRLLFLFSLPVLSDDYFRFAWDGTMLTSGANPYTIVPSEYMKDCDKHLYYLIDLFNGMNSPDYYTVYPPVCQFIFGWSAQLFPDNIWGTAIMLRCFCIAAEIGTIVLLLRILSQLNMPKRNVLIYALNPLVIIELSGNIHFEAVMIFFLMLAVHLMIKAGSLLKAVADDSSGFSPLSVPILHPEAVAKKRPQLINGFNRTLIFSAISFAVAVSTKLIPLMFLPFLIRRLKWKTSLVYFSVIAVTFSVLFIPFLNQQLLIQWGSSLQLYFRHFEFNAGIYYLVRFIGFQTVGEHIIQQAGFGLAAVTFISVLLLAAREKDSSWKHFFAMMQWSLTMYLLLATTVHPWYITTLVLCSVITGYRYPLVWSLFIAFSYATYQTIPYRENLWLVLVEYAAVIGTIVYELHLHLLKSKSISRE